MIYREPGTNSLLTTRANQLAIVQAMRERHDKLVQADPAVAKIEADYDAALMLRNDERPRL